MNSFQLNNVWIINEQARFQGSIRVRKGLIERIEKSDQPGGDLPVIDGKGRWLIPGIIDDQVHFREPGLTHKACIATESRAGVAGGVTSYMEMPNTKPSACTRELLEDKYAIAAQTSLTNYSFYLGVNHHNLDEIMALDRKNVCGIKIFMGSSTGDLLVDDPVVLDRVFKNSPHLIATHCEDDVRVKMRLAEAQKKYGVIPPEAHAEIRDETACLNSSRFAVELAQKHGTRLHVLHITTAEELALFRNDLPLEEKRITAEACVHHLWFDSSDYARLGNQIKCNPAIKEARHKEAIFNAVFDDRIDVIATDHAPHTWDEKMNRYEESPAGLPLIQHTLNIMMAFMHQGRVTMEQIVQKMAHNPARLFRIEHRGFLREGYFADMVLVDPNETWTVEKNQLLYRCGWSPFEGESFKGRVKQTWVNGFEVFNGQIVEQPNAAYRLTFRVE